MGCWNHTCAITNVPIFAGEEVEVILLQSSSNTDGASFCDTNEYHSPLELTFSGKYNDYGDVEECEGPALNIIVDSIREHLFEMEVGENEYHDIAVKKDEFDIVNLFKLDHEQRLYIHNHYKHVPYDSRDKCRINHIVVLKDVYDEIVETTSYDAWSKGIITATSLRAEIPKFLDDLDYVLNTKFSDEIKHIMAEIENVIGDTNISNILKNSITGSVYRTYPLRVSKKLKAMRTEGSDDIEGVINNLIRFHMFQVFMMHARKSWHVPSGVGSQDESTESQELCASVTLKAAEKVKERFKE